MIVKIDIQFTANNIFATNVFHADVVSLAAGETVMDSLADITADSLPGSMKVVSGRVSTLTPDDASFISKAYALDGTRSSEGNILPLWNRFNITFNVGPTYLCRKFLAGVTEGDQIDGFVVSSTIAQLQTLYIAPLIALGVLCSPDGNAFLSGSAKLNVAMRQLRRRKKRSTPVIPLTA